MMMYLIGGLIYLAILIPIAILIGKCIKVMGADSDNE